MRSIEEHGFYDEETRLAEWEHALAERAYGDRRIKTYLAMELIKAYGHDPSEVVSFTLDAGSDEMKVINKSDLEGGN